MQRNDGRSPRELRTIVVQEKAYGYAPGAVLLEIGNTKLLCSVTLQQGVPPFLRGKGSGWLSAEYGMLPTATQDRVARQSSTAQSNGRSVEISRLIGRALRSMVNLKVLGEYTVLIDCDVLQADGGTRTAAISGACLALLRAQEAWLSSKLLKAPLITDMVAAVSVGIVNGVCVLDPSYQEDSGGQADFNFVIARSGGIVEIQGGAEKAPVTWDLFAQAQQLAQEGVNCWFDLFDQEGHKNIRSGTRSHLSGITQTQNQPQNQIQNNIPAESHNSFQQGSQNSQKQNHKNIHTVHTVLTDNNIEHNNTNKESVPLFSLQNRLRRAS